MAVIFVGAARLGLAIGFTAEQVTRVWPAGLALSAMLLFGPSVWPGILLGAFLANVMAHQPVAIALAIAAGHTLAAATGLRLLRRVARIDQTLDTLRQALGLVAFGAVASTIVGAAIGVAGLCLAGAQPWTAFGTLWGARWLGDATGVVLIVPAFLTWHAWRDAPRGRIGEAALLLSGLAAISAGVFGGLFRTGTTAQYPLEYIVFPFLIWAATRFGTAGAAAANLVIGSIALWGTVHGPSAYAPGNAAGLMLPLFLAVVAATALLLGATISERTAALGRRNAEHAVTRVLADATSASDATARIIDAVNADLNWDIGLWWPVDSDARRLRCADIRCRPAARFPELERASRARTLGSGEGLAGRVWASAAPQWVPDVHKADDVVRLQAAEAGGLRAAFAFPISLGNEVLGVFEFRSRSVRRHDDGLLWMFTAIGAEVGQFLARKRMEQQVQESEARKAGMLNAALDCIITVDQDGRIVEFNPAAERTFRYRASEILGRFVVDVLIPEADRRSCREQLEGYRACPSGRDSVIGRRLEVVGMRADGSKFPAELSIAKISSAGGSLYTGFLRDITRQKRRARQLAFRATHDGLTKLLNRSAFMDRLKEAVAHSREVRSLIAILFIDLDHFKALNDSLGHLVGDRLLVETARRLRRCVRPGDAVARLGGDEFAILLERVIGLDAASATADRIDRELDRPFAADGREVRLSASVGIAMNERHDDRPDDLLRNADAAMYRAKAAGAGRSLSVL